MDMSLARQKFERVSAPFFRVIHKRTHVTGCSFLPLVAVAVLLPAFAAACGQVITVTPTPTLAPTATISVAVLTTPSAPTATPAPYTPAPTLTPTMTPTPDIHTVASGESLLTIANLYNVSVAALQEANGVLDPRTLQIGQQLIIPREEEAEAAADATATPTPMALEIENLHFSETSIGGLWVLGEAHNTSGQPLEQVRVGVTLLDENGTPLLESGSLAALDLLDVDESSPFAMLIEDAPESFDGYRAYALSAVPAYVGSYYRDLSVEDLELDPERYASYTVDGRVFNTGPEEAVEVRVVLTAYDPLGRVVAVRQVVPEHNVIPRGGNTEFNAVLSPLGGPVERVMAQAQGRRMQP
ncbi:MAG: LysM peptidoglycan-binding domain-containing protein [Caldilineaceae bacterium]